MSSRFREKMLLPTLGQLQQPYELFLNFFWVFKAHFTPGALAFEPGGACLARMALCHQCASTTSCLCKTQLELLLGGLLAPQ